MPDTETVASKKPLWSEPRRWAKLLNLLQRFIDFRSTDPYRGYLELKEFAETQLSLLPIPAPERTDDVMDERAAIPEARNTVPPNSSRRLGELLDAVVDDPGTWLSTPSEQLGGRKPLELIGTEEEDKIVCLLQAVDQGLF